MHPAFANIRFGPFASAYHSAAMTPELKEALGAFLERELLPQVEQPFASTSGALVAAYDAERYCGPNSAVRDIYKFEFAFHRSSGDDTIKVDLLFRAQARAFSARRSKPLYLWTPARRDRYEAEGRQLQHLCGCIARREGVEAVCPLCSAVLRVHDSPSLFDVSCPSRCFKYNYHRDPANGQFLHGHFFRKEPGDV
ncbi:hypothetical protein WME95_06820 [Sorangium sp. So ce327]|uniref:hypothetical protein n=1 Tax=Sorangium sp. So ce327 TaxID=3133301 RepID=UPI003F63ECD2